MRLYQLLQQALMGNYFGKDFLVTLAFTVQYLQCTYLESTG